MDNQYLNQKMNRKKIFLRIVLAFNQLYNKPFLNLLWILVGTVATLGIIGRLKLVEYISIPQLIVPIFNIALDIFVFLIIIIMTLAILYYIGECTARQAESDLIIAFSANDLRNGHPILINKRKIKGTGVTVREFYSNIPYDVWIANKEAIADSMNVHFVEEIKYGGKGNNNGKRIILTTAKGRKSTDKGILYDDEF